MAPVTILLCIYVKHYAFNSVPLGSKSRMYKFIII